MDLPEGTLTPSQFEILQLLWDSTEAMSVVDIWEKILVSRSVNRTTVLNLVDRLEKRRWLSREKIDGVYKYRANVARSVAEGKLSEEFLASFFGGSTSSFLLSLLGSKKISKSELKRLKVLLDETSSPRTK